MTRFGTLMVALGLAALVAAPAHAQGGRGFGMGMGGGAMLTNKGVQKELKLTDDQVQKVEALASSLRDSMRDRFQSLQDVPQEERGAKMQALMREVNEETNGKLKGIFSKEQMARYEQISLQTQGVNAFLNPDVQAKLKLTDDQKGKIRSLVEDMQGQMREVFQEFQNDREGATRKLTEMRKAVNDKAMNVLTDDQKKTWKELTGEPFEVRFEGRRAA